MAAGSYISTGYVFGRERLASWIRLRWRWRHRIISIRGWSQIYHLPRLDMYAHYCGFTVSRNDSCLNTYCREWLQDYLKVERPFASQTLWTGAGDLFNVLGHSLISPSKFGQSAFDFVEAWISKVELDMTFDISKLASSWTRMRMSVYPRLSRWDNPV